MNSSNNTVPFELESSNYEKKLGFVNNQFHNWWKNWYDQVFEHLVPFNKLKQQKPNLTINSIIIIKYDKKCSKPEYKMARVLEAPTVLDGLIRTR